MTDKQKSKPKPKAARPKSPNNPNQKFGSLENINESGVWLEGFTGISFPLDKSLKELVFLPPVLSFEDLDPALASIRGLFYETTRNDGVPVLKISQDLKRGDTLHRGLLGPVLTNEQHWDLITNCRISNALAHGDLLLTLGRATWNYVHYRELGLEHDTLGQHRARLADMANGSAQLSPAVDLEPDRFLWSLIESDNSPVNPKKPFADIAWFRAALRTLKERATKRAASDEELQRLRFDDIPSLENTKRPERRYLWEPVFEFWVRSGQKLTYSENGYIMRVLSVIHKGLRIDPPKANSVRHAIREFKGTA